MSIKPLSDLIFLLKDKTGQKKKKSQKGNCSHTQPTAGFNNRRLGVAGKCEGYSKE